MMSDRPTRVSCELCGGPVDVRPSGRIPKRHPNGCPTAVSRETAVERPAEPAPVPRETMTSGPPERATLSRATQISPVRWLMDDGTILDNNGNVVGVHRR